jgi:DNA-binding CsgD family transcriptional regulator
VLQRLYGLTPSEAKISMLIAQGISLKDVADTLGISMGTARSHLNHVFKKTGSHRQAHLVQQINTGPAWVKHRCAT